MGYTAIFRQNVHVIKIFIISDEPFPISEFKKIHVKISGIAERVINSVFNSYTGENDVRITSPQIELWPRRGWDGSYYTHRE